MRFMAVVRFKGERRRLVVLDVPPWLVWEAERHLEDARLRWYSEHVARVTTEEKLIPVTEEEYLRECEELAWEAECRDEIDRLRWEEAQGVET